MCRVENGIEELGFAEQMSAFSKMFHDELVKICGMIEIICIDGKAMCGTVQANGRNLEFRRPLLLLPKIAQNGKSGVSGQERW